MPKCTTPWRASHSVAATFTPELSVAYSLRGKVRSWWPVQSSTVPPFGTMAPDFFTAASRSAGVISARGAMWRRSTQMPDDAVFERIFVDRLAGLVEMPGRVDVGAGVVGHRDEHRGKPVHIAGGDEGLFVRGPDAVDDGRMAGIGRGLVVELAAEVDDLHDWKLRRDAAGLWFETRGVAALLTMRVPHPEE